MKNSEIKVPESVEQYAREDIADVIKLTQDYDTQLTIKDESFEAYRAGDDPDSYSVDASFTIHDQDSNKDFDFVIEYVVKGDDVYVGGDVEELAHSFNDRWNDAITAATKIGKKQRIVADDEGYDVAESIDDLADAVDDMQDTVDDMSEDEVDIQMDNNITNHFIAECDVCHGVFISALVESDQDVYTITGKCPLCDKESEQYLKWVIKDANNADVLKVQEEAYEQPGTEEEEDVLEPEVEEEETIV